MKASALLFAVTRAHRCLLQAWGMKVTYQLSYFDLESGQGSGAVGLCAGEVKGSALDSISALCLTIAKLCNGSMLELVGCKRANGSFLPLFISLL